MGSPRDTFLELGLWNEVVSLLVLVWAYVEHSQHARSDDPDAGLGERPSRTHPAQRYRPLDICRSETYSPTTETKPSRFRFTILREISLRPELVGILVHRLVQSSGTVARMMRAVRESACKKKTNMVLTITVEPFGINMPL